MLSTLFFCFALGSATPLPAEALQAQAPRVPELYLGDLDSALRAAQERNAVVAIFVLQEGEEANDRFRDGVLRAGDFIQQARRLLVIVANDGEHEIIEWEEKDAEGEKVQRSGCSVYGTPMCNDHSRHMQRVFQDYNEEGTMQTPTLILLTPDGKLAERVHDQHDLPFILKEIDAVIARSGPSLTRVELLEVKEKLRILRREMGRGRWVPSWKTAGALLAITQHGTMAEEATEAQAFALEGMQEDLDHVLAAMENQDVQEAYGRLRKLVDEYRDTPLEKKSRRAQAAVEKDPRFKDEIRLWKREAAAAEDWKEVEQALAENKEKKALRMAQKILRKYPATRAGKKAKELIERMGPGGGALAHGTDRQESLQ